MSRGWGGPPDAPEGRTPSTPSPAALEALEALVALGVLADRVRRLLHAASGGRIIIGITGSPGAGKTMLARVLVGALNDGPSVG